MPTPFSYHHEGVRHHRTPSRDRGLPGLKVHGALARWLWGDADMLFLVGGWNWTAVILVWARAYLAYRRGSRLIPNLGAGP